MLLALISIANDDLASHMNVYTNLIYFDEYIKKPSAIRTSRASFVRIRIDNDLLRPFIVPQALPFIFTEEQTRNCKHWCWHAGKALCSIGPQADYFALKTYLENVPGFMISRAAHTGTWDSWAFEQHNYLSRQFLKTFALFNESYGHVFPVDSGDIKMTDILHNDRIHVVLIPSLELSKSEAATLGKPYSTLMKWTLAEMERQPSRLASTTDAPKGSFHKCRVDVLIARFGPRGFSDTKKPTGVGLGMILELTFL